MRRTLYLARNVAFTIAFTVVCSLAIWTVSIVALHRMIAAA